MGNSGAISAGWTYSNHSWKTVQPKRRSIPGTPSICQTQNGHFEADCYDITVTSTLDQLFGSLSSRKNLKVNRIVKLLDVVKKEKQMFECNIREHLEVYTQTIVCRLQELLLTQRQALFLLRQAFVTFFELYGFSGNYFRVSAKMIGFGTDGQIRVWLNENYGQSEISQDSIARSEYEMLISIVKVFQNFGINTRRFYGFMTFEQAIAELNRSLSQAETKQLSRTIIKKVLQNEIPKTTKKVGLGEKDQQFRHKKRSSIAQLVPEEPPKNTKQNILSQCPRIQYKQTYNPFTPSDTNKISLSRPFEKRSQLKGSNTPPTCSSFSTIERPPSSLQRASSPTPSIRMQYRDREEYPVRPPSSIVDLEQSYKSIPELQLTQKSLSRTLQKHFDLVSRITQRSNEEDTNSYFGSQVERPAQLGQETGRQQIVFQDRLLSPKWKSANYFTRMDL